MGSNRVLFCVIAWLFLASCAAWAASPAEWGPYGIGELREDIADVSRGREIDLLILYPLTTGAGEVPEAGYPLVLFNHGFMLWGGLYRSYGEQLASHGFVVALPSYAMSFAGISHTELAADARFAIDRCLALDIQTGSALFGLVDESEIGAAGHSLGGKLALLEAVTDERVRAIATLDPMDGGGPVADDPILYPSVAPERMPQIHVPLLFVGAELGGIAYFLIPCAPPADNYEQFYEAANSPAIEITQLGAGHGQYADPGAESMLAACAPGTVSDDGVRSSSAAYLTAFFLGHLGGDASALAWLDAQLLEDEAQSLVVVRRK
jgi:pimeloyl-ACP methyl ester carboxylesterase